MRFMTEVSELRRARKEEEINNVAWIRNEENPADALTRPSSNKFLKKALSTGKLIHKTEKWISKGVNSSAGDKRNNQATGKNNKGQDLGKDTIDRNGEAGGKVQLNA